MVAALASGSQLRRVIDSAMDSRPGRHGEDVVRLPRASGAGLQSNQERAAVARLSNLLHSDDPDGVECGGTARQSDRISICAGGLVDYRGQKPTPAIAGVLAG